MTEEHKKSGYAKFYQIKIKEMNEPDFGQASKLISEAWNRLDETQRQLYKKEVSSKRKEMLKKKASQQAAMVAQGTINNQFN